MASALDLIAAVGQTFGERPEAVRALPRPPDVAFVLCVFALLWACLWRGALRWLGAPLFAASVALYVAAPQPVVAFDADLRAIYARDDGRWTLIAGSRPLHLRARSARRDAGPLARRNRTPRAAGNVRRGAAVSGAPRAHDLRVRAATRAARRAPASRGAIVIAQARRAGGLRRALPARRADRAQRASPQLGGAHDLRNAVRPAHRRAHGRRTSRRPGRRARRQRDQE